MNNIKFQVKNIKFNNEKEADEYHSSLAPDWKIKYPVSKTGYTVNVTWSEACKSFTYGRVLEVTAATIDGQPLSAHVDLDDYADMKACYRDAIEIYDGRLSEILHENVTCKRIDISWHEKVIYLVMNEIEVEYGTLFL